MAAKVVVEGSSNVTASQLKDLFRQVEDRSLGYYHLQALLEHRNPFEFERNQHGHVVLTFIGLDLTGAQEVERLGAAYRVGELAKSCLLSTATDSYDANHRLVLGQEYKVALVPHSEIKRDSDRTTRNLREWGRKNYGYGKPLAGLTPRIRERLSDKQLEELGLLYVVVLHDPIVDSDGDPRVLDAGRRGGGRWLGTCWARPDDQWYVGGASAFPVLASGT